MGISFKMGKGSVCGVYTSLKPMIHFDSKQSQSIFNQNYYKNAMANNCKQCSIRIISHTTTPPPKAYDCVAVYIAGRRTSLVVYGWWPQPPTKKKVVSAMGHWAWSSSEAMRYGHVGLVTGIWSVEVPFVSLQWRHNERDGVSNHQPHDCLLNRLFKAQVKENLKAPRHWPLWGEFTGDR